MNFCRFYNPPTNQGAPGYYGYDQQQQQHQPQPPVATAMPGNFSQQQQQQQPANFMTPGPVQQQPQQHQPQHQPRAAPAPKEVLPIPPEHLDLQSTFDGLRLKCMAAASHPVGNIFCHPTKGAQTRS